MLTLCFLPRSGGAGAAPPSFPRRFYGTVKVYGEWVPEGTLLIARVEGTEIIVTTQTALEYNPVSGQNNSVYSLDILGDDPSTSQKEGGALGDRVYFEIEYGGVNLPTAESYLWDDIPGWVSLNLTVPLQATLSGLPTGTVNYTTADITLGGGGVVAYKYKIDNGVWSQERPVVMHILLAGLGDGPHTVYVVGKNAQGTWQAESEATTASWVVDTTPPEARLSGQPTGVVNYSTANITVGGDGVVSYKYKLDAGQWSGERVVGTPIVLSGLSDGEHMIYVIGKDAVGNWQAESNASTAGWTVKTMGPQATLLGQPTGTVNYNTAEIFVQGADMVAYRWKLDSNSWSEEEPITASITLSGLSDGSHTIYVISRDAGGNWQEEPTTASWWVDTMPPMAMLSGEPEETVTSNSADITVGGTDVVAYKYRLDDGFWSGEMPVENHILLSGLSDGAHTLYALGKDDVGNWQAEADATVVGWVVDTTAPSLPILISPASRAKVKNSPVSFRWSAVDDASGVRYDLQVSSSSDFRLLWVAVEGQDSNSYSTAVLQDGTYYWRVKAVDGVGNDSGWSESRSFKLGGEGGGGWWLAVVIALVGIGALGAIFWWRRQSTKI